MEFSQNSYYRFTKFNLIFYFKDIKLSKPIAEDLGKNFQDEGTSLHLEAFYRVEVTKNIEMTPSLIVIINLKHNNSNSPIYLGTIRNTFSF